MINKLADFNDDDVVIVSDSKGWSNIEEIRVEGNSIIIYQEEYPVFSDS